MSKWIYTHDEGEQEVVDLTDDEAAELMAAQDDDEEEDDGDGDDYDPDPPAAPARQADTPAEFARVDEVYRKERAAIRASNDPADLRFRRQAMERALADARQSNIAHTRARDLLGEIEQRELRLRAERLATRSR